MAIAASSMAELPVIGDDEAHALRAIEAAIRRGERAQAAELACALLARGAEHPLVLNLAALSSEEAGRDEEAERLLRRAVVLAPADPGSRNALGLCLLRLDRADEALAEFEQLLAAQPTLAFVHANRGNALFALGEIDAAEASFKRAIELQPTHCIAAAGLARIAAGRGIFPGARHWAERALATLPDLPDATLSLAAAELGEGKGPSAESRVRRLLQHPRLAPLERANAYGLLGDVLDAAKRHGEAFEAYAECNRSLRALYAPRYGGAHPAFEYATGMIRVIEQIPRERWRPPGPAAATRAAPSGHVFLLGFPRSGTTLLEVVLEGHSRVVSLEERESLLEGIREFMRRPEDLERLAQASADELEAFRTAYWRNVERSGVQVQDKVFVDKHPFNTLKLPLIARLFPNARIVFACRDPRDIVLSCFRHRFQMSAPIFELLSLEDAARYYDAVMRFGLTCIGAAGLTTCLVRHEDLVTEFNREMQRVCAFLAIEWEPAMGDFALRSRARAMLTPSTAQLLRGLNTEGVGQWRHYRDRLAPVLALLAPWIKQFLYDD
jgi:tetratricopeptide (TPR) repeat protein